MKKVKDYVKKYRDMGYTCAESTLLACDEAWDLNLPEGSSKFLAGFGGGMCTGYVCGAISGGVAGLSYKYVRVNGHESPLLAKKVSTFLTLVQERLGTKLCKELQPRFLTEEENCTPTVWAITEILDEVEAMDFDVPEHSEYDLRFPPEGKPSFRDYECVGNDEE